MKVWMLLLAAFALPLNAAAETDLERVVSALKQERAVGRGIFLPILGGAGRAFVQANVALKVRNLPMFYCQPMQLTLNESNYADIALEQYERDKPIFNEDPFYQKYPVDALVYALFQGLQRTFPCK